MKTEPTSLDRLPPLVLEIPQISPENPISEPKQVPSQHRVQLVGNCDILYPSSNEVSIIFFFLQQQKEISE